jgi:hypothetical protein
MIKSEQLYPQPETVHIEKLKEDLEPLETKTSEIVDKYKIIMIGEEDHFDQYTPEYSFRVFKTLSEQIVEPQIIFIESKDKIPERIKHYQKIADYCKEKGIEIVAVDTETTGDNSMDIARDIKMQELVSEVMQKHQDYKFIFIGGSSHCNKSGRHEKSPYEEYSQGNLATLLINQGESVGSVSLHVTKPLEALARTIDEQEQVMCLPGAYAPLYYQKRFLGFSGLTESQWHADEESFDLLTFVPTQNSLINRHFGHPYDRHTVYLE